MKSMREKVEEFVRHIKEEVDNAIMNRPDVQDFLEGGYLIVIEIDDEATIAKIRKAGDTYEEVI